MWSPAIARRCPTRGNGRRESHVGRSERIASELLVKVGIRVSPRTVTRYMPTDRPLRAGTGSQWWSTVGATMRARFWRVFGAISATFRVFYVFVVMEVGTRWIPHWNVTEHPTAEWTAQQFRMVMSGDEPHRFSAALLTRSTPTRVRSGRFEHLCCVNFPFLIVC